MRRVFPIVVPVLALGAAIGTALPSGRGGPAWLALGLFLIGHALRWISLDRGPLKVRQRLELSQAAGLRIMMILYAAAGLAAIAAAILNLPAVGAMIVSVFLLSWSAFWVWALHLTRAD